MEIFAIVMVVLFITPYLLALKSVKKIEKALKDLEKKQKESEDTT